MSYAISTPHTHVSLEADTHGLYVLDRAYSHEWLTGNRLLKLTVEAGQVWDGASVPRWCWSIIRPGGLILGPSLIHDVIYEHGGRPANLERWDGQEASWKPCTDSIGRLRADKLFARMIRQVGLPSYKASVAYRAVRVFGASHWG